MGEYLTVKCCLLSFAPVDFYRNKNLLSIFFKNSSCSLSLTDIGQQFSSYIWILPLQLKERNMAILVCVVNHSFSLKMSSHTIESINKSLYDQHSNIWMQKLSHSLTVVNSTNLKWLNLHNMISQKESNHMMVSMLHIYSQLVDGQWQIWYWFFLWLFHSLKNCEKEWR